MGLDLRNGSANVTSLKIFTGNSVRPEQDFFMEMIPTLIPCLSPSHYTGSKSHVLRIPRQHVLGHFPGLAF